MSSVAETSRTFTDEQLFADLTILNEIEVDEHVIEKAENEDSDALYTIGEIYYYKEDYQKSLAWFMKAAAKDNSNAQNRIGYQYQHGYGVPLDCKTAMEWYLKADANGNRNAPNNIGWLHHNAMGTPKDQKLALHYYVKSGIRGHKVAQSNIGISLEKGRGVAVDKQHALEWYQRSADQGYQKAKECIEKLNSAGFQLDIKQLATLGLEQRVQLLEKENEQHKESIKTLNEDKAELKKKLKYNKYKYRESTKELEEKLTALQEENNSMEHKRIEMENRLLLLEQERQEKRRMEKRMRTLEKTMMKFLLKNDKDYRQNNTIYHSDTDDACYDGHSDDEAHRDLCYDEL